MIIFDSFLIFAQNTECGYMLELPHGFELMIRITCLLCNCGF